MAGRARRGHEEPLPVRAARDRERHITQVGAYGFFTPRRPRQSVTVTPPPLRYWQYDAARWWVVALVVAGLAAWLGLLAWRSGGGAVSAEVPLAVVLAVLVVAFSSGRLTVSDAAVSTDIAGLRRTSSFGIVPLALVRDVVVGPAPAEWTRVRHRGGWWPGRTRIAVRHLASDGETERGFTVWVRDPDAFADALGHPLEGLQPEKGRGPEPEKGPGPGPGKGPRS